MSKHVIILGSGVSGLGAAWRLAWHGVSVSVLEAESHVGGLARTEREDGYCLDLGPHSFFSDEDWILHTVLDLFDRSLDPLPRDVKFFYNGKYLDYPLTAQGVLLQTGLISGIKMALSYLKGRIAPHRGLTLGTEEETVEDWAISSFGEHLYRTFFKPYTEQFWQMPCTELSSKAIPTHTRMSFLNTLSILLRRRMGKNGKSLIEREALPTYYPKTGFGEIAEKMAETVRYLGGSIHLACEAVGVMKLNDGKMCVTYDSNGKNSELRGDYVISTVPLPSLVRMLSPRPSAEVLISTGKLDYRPMVALGIATKKQNVLGCGYMYMLDRPYNRISELNEFSPQTSPVGQNIIMLEIPCLRHSAIWGASKEKLFDLCKDSLAEDNFLRPSDMKRLFLVKSPCAYPIYRRDYRRNLRQIMDYLKRYDSLATLGRCGEFIYMDIDACIKRAFDLADSLMARLHGQSEHHVRMPSSWHKPDFSEIKGVRT